MEGCDSKYRNSLPQLAGRSIFLTDAGMETTLIFHDHIDLPEFASFILLRDEEDYERLLKYSDPFLELAKKHELGFILESVTWRANSYWGHKLGFSDDELKEINRKAIKLCCEVREKHETPKTPIVISGTIGPRADGYQVTQFMTPKEAEIYHLPQIKTFSETEADMICAYTINYVGEAIGIIKAAQSVNMPVVISFTLETDGKLPSGQTLKDAIETADRETNNGALYYMINCVHPIHLESLFDTDEPWMQRIRGFRANSSTKSHAELNECETLDEGNPDELAKECEKLLDKLQNIVMLGGCCGTDYRHVEKICKACILKIMNNLNLD